MLRILSVAVVLGLVAGPAWGQADGPYQIKIKRLAKGESELVDKSEKATQNIKIEDNNGNLVKEQKENKGDVNVYLQTVLERKGNKRPTKMTRKYEKATVTKDGTTTKLSYEGKTVLIEKKGDRYVFRVEGGEELTGEDAKELNKEFNKKGEIDEKALEELLLPGKAVKVGEEWKLDVSKVSKAFEEDGALEIVPEKTKGTGKLLRAYKKDGRQFGVIQLRLDMALKSVSEEGNKVVLQADKSKMQLEFTIDTCIDGTSATADGTWRVSANIEALLPSPDQPMARLRVTIAAEGKGKNVEQGRK
jgi:hypothetical protein